MGLLTGLLTACSGFLLAVLWMDLIFDTQIRGDEGSALPSIAGYYRRATTTSQPMGRLIAGVMVVLLIALAVEAFAGDSPGWLIGVSALLSGVPVALALTRTVPNAVRLGRRTDSVAEQIRLARAIYRDHIVCAVGMLAFLVLWLGWLGR